MNVGLNTFSGIGSNYYSNTNDKESYTRVNGDSSKNKDPQEDKKSQDKSTNELSVDEKRVVQNLQARDTEVRAHEAAHQAASGGMAGAASYTYQKGPDGKMYAIGGEVPISMKQGSSPEETLRNARQIAAAAMAPANPSPQDYSVASSARVMEMKAQQQIAKQHQEEISGKETYKSEADKSKTSNNSGGIDIPA
jgi:hypothetical protein